MIPNYFNEFVERYDSSTYILALNSEAPVHVHPSQKQPTPDYKLHVTPIEENKPYFIPVKYLNFRYVKNYMILRHSNPLFNSKLCPSSPECN